MQLLFCPSTASTTTLTPTSRLVKTTNRPARRAEFGIPVLCCRSSTHITKKKKIQLNEHFRSISMRYFILRCCRKNIRYLFINFFLVQAKPWGAFHLGKISGSIGLNGNGTLCSTGNFPNQTDDLPRYSTSFAPASWNRNFRSIIIKEFKQERRRRLRKRHFKSEFALPQTIALIPSRLIRQMLANFWELNSKGLHQSSEK